MDEKMKQRKNKKFLKEYKEKMMLMMGKIEEK